MKRHIKIELFWTRLDLSTKNPELGANSMFICRREHSAWWVLMILRYITKMCHRIELNETNKFTCRKHQNQCKIDGFLEHVLWNIHKHIFYVITLRYRTNIKSGIAWQWLYFQAKSGIDKKCNWCARSYERLGSIMVDFTCFLRFTWTHVENNSPACFSVITLRYRKI